MTATDTRKPVICVYHSADFDGECSAAIVLRNTVNCTLIPYNHGEPFPWSLVEQSPRATCYLVDLGLPLTFIQRLAAATNLIWIDHHASAIAEAKAANFHPPGLRDTLSAACELTWQYFSLTGLADMPLAVRLLGRYDCWDHNDPRTLPFQYFMRSYQDTTPYNEALWSMLFSQKNAEYVEKCAHQGDDFFRYQQARDLKAITQFGFQTHMFGYKTLACNSLPGGSQLFTVHPEASAFELFAMFYWRHKIGWTISLYTENPAINVGEIARRMGGGGHQSAAGYTVNQLPEELQVHHA